jgi:hypothetical protein
MRGLAFDDNVSTKRAEMMYAIATPKSQWDPTPSPLRPELLEES